MKLKTLTRNLLKGDIMALFKNTDKRQLHPVEVAQVFNSLPPDSISIAFKSFSYDNQLQVFPYLDPSIQKRLILDMPGANASTLLNAISLDDRVSFYATLKDTEIGEFLEFLDEDNKKATLDILGLPKQSVARLINNKFATLKKEMTVAEASEYLRLNQPDTETANVVYVVDENGKLIEDIPIRRVVLPVTNKDDLLMGVVTIDDVLDAEEQRNTREMQKFGGMESLDYPYVKTPFFSLVRKRAGWLIILFVGEMLTATAMGYFDKEISKAVVLALFVPLIISSGGNSGSQAATLIIRAMAVKELSIRDW